ncbi:MAG: BamA/TamA family outer membrane protein [Chitinophagales bacterium]|nr:BamA/TamA family outer membrane protein [Chitinophagales bacterium]
MSRRIYILYSIIFLLFNQYVSAQEGSSLFIRNITVEGNKHTREFVILRELTFQESDTILGIRLSKEFEKSQTNLQNLALFAAINFNIKNWENDSLDIVISVTERARFRPIPIFNLADRNFNVWWTEQNRSFKRVQYGAMVVYKNAFGLNHTISGTATFGFAQNYEVEYRVPYFNKKKSLGGNFKFGFTQSKQVQTGAFEDQTQFLEADKHLRRRYEVNTNFIYRPKIRNIHSFKLNYFHYNISDILSNSHPDYLLDGRNRVDFFQLGYSYEADFRNFKFFPTSGWFLKVDFERDGLGMFKEDVNLTRMTFTYNHYISLGESGKHFTSHSMRMMLSGPEKQPYFLTRGMGFRQDFVRGNELYLIDGQRFFLFKNDYKYKVLDVKLNYIKKLKGKKFGLMPLSLYVGGHFDAGAVRDSYYAQGNTLRNKMIYGWGVGVDFVTFYDRVFRLEYSFNQDFKNGVYLHFELPI